MCAGISESPQCFTDTSIPEFSSSRFSGWFRKYSYHSFYSIEHRPWTCTVGLQLSVGSVQGILVVPTSQEISSLQYVNLVSSFCLVDKSPGIPAKWLKPVRSSTNLFSISATSWVWEGAKVWLPLTNGMWLSIAGQNYFWGRLLTIPGWPPTCYEVEDDFEFCSSCLSSLCWGYKYALTLSVHLVLGMEPRTPSILASTLPTKLHPWPFLVFLQVHFFFQVGRQKIFWVIFSLEEFDSWIYNVQLSRNMVWECLIIVFGSGPHK